MNTRACVLLPLGVALALTLSTPAYSQDVPLASGSSVRVHTVSTDEVLHGVVVESTNDRLTLRVNEHRVEIPMSDVRRLELEVHDSLMNGTLIGAAVLGAICVLICGQGLDSSDDMGPVVLTNAVLGGAIGAIVDWRMNAHMIIYERPGGASQSRTRAAVPLLTLRF